MNFDGNANMVFSQSSVGLDNHESILYAGLLIMNDNVQLLLRLLRENALWNFLL
jgi:hypothetical protein